MAYLRSIQQDLSSPSSVRQAAERLTTTVTRRQTAPFTADPRADETLLSSGSCPVMRRFNKRDG
jgi:uncharacterized protein (UPF0147 family)